MQQQYPILEHDPAAEAFIEPSRVIRAIDAPEHCVLVFFNDVVGRLVNEGRLTQIACPRSEIGPHPLYEMDMDGRRLAVMHPGVGAPLAGALLEEAIAFGCRKFVACGGAGVLVPEMALGHLVVPTAAVRDEGTSYHYLPPAREVAASAEGVATIERTLSEAKVPYVLGKTWTTDAIYRETPAKIALRKSEGCLTVEMEAAAFFAVAQFRGVTFAQILYCGDDLSGEAWDDRGWNHHSDRETIFWLAAEACLAIG